MRFNKIRKKTEDIRSNPDMLILIQHLISIIDDKIENLTLSKKIEDQSSCIDIMRIFSMHGFDIDIYQADAILTKICINLCIDRSILVLASDWGLVWRDICQDWAFYDSDLYEDASDTLLMAINKTE